MVKIVYSPPAKGIPFTHYGMPAYGPRLGQETRFTLWIAKQPQGPLLLGAIGLVLGICAIPQLVCFSTCVVHVGILEFFV